MVKIDSAIKDINDVICKNINKFDNSERGLLSQNIIAQLRNLLDHISLKAYSKGQDIEITYDNIKEANKYISSVSQLKFLNKFHKLLQISASHYTLKEDSSERLMLKYYEYLLNIKSYLKKTYNLEVLENISDFPLNTDSTMNDYYEKIAQKLNQVKIVNSSKNTYYIQKIKPFFVNYEVYYEVTFTIANDKNSKFDRIIAFTKLDISQNYAVKLYISNDKIEILGKDTPILIINNYEVSIRPCEFNNFAKIFGKFPKVSAKHLEYTNLMKFLTVSGMHLTNLMDDTEYYLKIKKIVFERAKTNILFDILDKCHEIISRNQPGCNIVRYLLSRLNNKIVKKQFNNTECSELSDLFLNRGCIPFDQMPFDTALVGHNPKLINIFDCISTTNREHELFARFIKNNTERNGILYTSKEEINNFENIENLIKLYNSKLYYKHTHRKLEIYKDNVYIKGYEDDTINIIKRLKELSNLGIKNYSNSINNWLINDSYGSKIDCDEKKGYLKLMFEKSSVALIYGSAGTGKSTIINHISNFYKDYKKLYLANTHPAIENLKRKVNSANGNFTTIAKFLSSNKIDFECDLLFIDECSTVSNSDMINILDKAKFKLLILVGDIFQIESITFGNWFNLAQKFIPETSIFELQKPYRSTNSNLIDLWAKVRNIDDNILEHITKNNYSTKLDESIFNYSNKDEIILCLNYDGVYGINNINKYLQINNSNKPIEWGINTYKIDDPILFNESVNESGRFGPAIYNNLKGKIVDIKTFDNKIQFFIEIDSIIDEFKIDGYELELVGNSSNGNSIISFFVNKYETIDDDEEDNASFDNIIPFQISYAVSIHKAQGLEYNSVKIVITNEVEEMITHNIFYTAITRAKENLKIYRSPEIEKKVLGSLEKRNINKDAGLLNGRINNS